MSTQALRTKSRRAAIQLPLKLFRLLQEPECFQTSEAFQTDLFRVDDDQPLDVILLDIRTNRYSLTPGMTSFTNDHAILQAMVMLFIVAKNQHGWSWDNTLEQLSIWKCHDVRYNPTTQLDNLWREETQNMSRNMLGNRDSYSGLDNFYSSSKKWKARQASGDRRPLHEVGEQACVQWALHTQTNDRQVANAAVLILKLFWKVQRQATPVVDGMTVVEKVSNLLFEQGEKDFQEKFLNRLIQGLEELWCTYFDVA